jgi:hypothetical protein
MPSQQDFAAGRDPMALDGTLFDGVRDDGEVSPGARVVNLEDPEHREDQDEEVVHIRFGSYQ